MEPVRSTRRTFLSCVSAEFRSYRDSIRGNLTGPHHEVKTQEDLVVGGHTLLETLDDYIRSCDAIVHLVGEGCGTRPKRAEVQAIRHRYPNLSDRVPSIALALAEADCPLTYTQWEYYLAVYHKIDRAVFWAQPGSRREPGWTATPESLASQEEHRNRIEEIGEHRGDLVFDDQKDVVIDVLRTMALGLRPASLARPRTSVIWPPKKAPPAYPLADRHTEFEDFLSLLSDSGEPKILLIHGPSDAGKSLLIQAFMNAANSYDEIACGMGDFKMGIPLRKVLGNAARSLKKRIELTRYQRAIERGDLGVADENLLTDLEESPAPVLLMLDTYEQATEECRLWVETQLMPLVSDSESLRLVILGQTVPTPPPSAADVTRTLPLKPIDDPKHWRRYCEQKYGKIWPEDQLSLLVKGLSGSPRGIAQALSVVSQS